MAVELTKEQRAVVENRGRSLLVSAAAGSGKTKVLVDRLFSQVAEGANIDDFLIITYTRAAASELHGKIAKALNARLEEDPNNAHLQRQMLRVYRADIETVDAFCTTLLRENCHLLADDAKGHALRPDFRILSESDAETLRVRVLSRVLEDFYEGLADGDGGTLLIDTLGAGRDDSALAQLVLEMHGKLQSQPYREAWLEQQRTLWRSLPASVDETAYGGIFLEMLGSKAHYWAWLLRRAVGEMAEDAVLNERYVPSFCETMQSLEDFAEITARGWDAARAAEIVFPRLGSVRNPENAELVERVKTLRDKCKTAAKKLKASLDTSAAEAMEDLRQMAPAMLALLDLTERFFVAYQQEKHRRNLADFSDQEHEAIHLLLCPDGTPSELALTVSQRYREIMVDEYQDTNEVQNRIFSAISRGGKNLFTVGDVKQSIYRFRLADPGIFIDHYRAYPNAADAAEGESGKILLSKNFRSRKEVLEATNFIFSNVMSREMGELDYGEEEMLVPGATYDEAPARETEFHLLSLTQQGLRAAEEEANFVADYAKRMIAGRFHVKDDATGEMRPVREEDIVILLRAPGTRLALYRRALESRGLHFSADENSNFFASMEVAVMISLLEIIDNPRQDVPLISVLRSPLFAFTPDRLAVLRGKTPRGDFYDALLADDGEDTKRFLETLHSLREEAGFSSVRELIFRIYLSCNALGVFGAMPDGEQRRENLIAFFSFAEELEESGYRGLFSFVSHLRELLEDGHLPSPQSMHSVRGIRVMSIHKSKGLEFPVVILADLAKPLNQKDFQTQVLVHPTLGLGPNCVDVKRHIRYSTVAREALERTLKRESKAEELRLLYVAMTRAKEKLVLVYTKSHAMTHISNLAARTSLPVSPEAVDDASCSGDWVLLPLLCRTEAEVLRRAAGAEGVEVQTCPDTPWGVYLHEERINGNGTDADAEETTERPALPFDRAALDYRYPHLAETGLPAKLTATQLKGRLLDAEIGEDAALPPRLRSMKKPKFLSPEQKLTGADRGTAIHLVMQYLDFSAQSAQEVRTQITDMLARRLLTREQAEAADVEAITAFLCSDLAARIRRSSSVEREYPFSILRPIGEYVPTVTSDDALLLQGVVDCFFEEDGKIVIVDFKTDRMTRGQLAEKTEAYRPQLAAYASALGRVLEKPVGDKILYFFTVDESVCL